MYTGSAEVFILFSDFLPYVQMFITLIPKIYSLLAICGLSSTVVICNINLQVVPCYIHVDRMYLVLMSQLHGLCRHKFTFKKTSVELYHTPLVNFVIQSV